MTRLLGLSGYARAGKDVMAAEFIKAGWIRYNFGDVIKALFDPFTQGDTGLLAFIQGVMPKLNPGEETTEKFHRFCHEVLAPYVLELRSISAFTEDDEEKTRIRPMLEHGGDLVYDWVERTYFERLDLLIAQGERVINTRVARTREARQWRERDGVVALIERQGWPPASDWEASVVEDLKAGGFVDLTIRNNAESGEDWARQSRELAAQFTDEPVVRSA